MRTRPLGRTGLDISELSLGGLFVASFAAEQAEANRVVQRAVELGVNYIDTAPNYGNSEEALGKALASVHEPVVLSTKLGGRPQPFDPKDPEQLRGSVKESLRLLGRESIEILMIHEPDRPGQYDWWSDRIGFSGPVLDVLQDLKNEGLVRFTGLGGTTAYQLPHLIKTGFFDVVLTAFNYSLLWREAEHAVLPAAVEQGMGIIIGSPLQQGALAVQHPEVDTGAWWLSSPRQKQFQKLYRLAEDLNMPLPELALRFVISNPQISTVLMGSRREEEVESNVAAVERGPLSASVLEELDRIAALVPFRPFEEPFGLPFGREFHGPWEAR